MAVPSYQKSWGKLGHLEICVNSLVKSFLKQHGTIKNIENGLSCTKIQKFRKNLKIQVFRKKNIIYFS